MKNVFRIVCVLLLAQFFWGCDEKGEPESPEPSRYYVKYEAKVKSIYSTTSISYSVAVNDGQKSFKQGKTFSQTFGPFEKGFVASIAVNASFLDRAECEAFIYVSQGEEPFALKIHRTGGKTLSLSYMIGE